jgi:hypothetical protein
MKKPFVLTGIFLCLLFSTNAYALDCGCNDWQNAFAAQLQQVETQRYAAMTGNDFNALSTLLGDDLLYIHSSGVAQTKNDFVESLKTGKMRYRKIAAKTQSARFYGDTAVLNGRGTFDVSTTEKDQTRDRSLEVIFTAVYLLRGEGLARHWELVSWQSTNAPPPKA